MKKLLLIAAIFTGLIANGQEDYKIHINDTVINVSLNSNYELMIGGKKIKFSLLVNDTLSYNDDLYQFKYPKDFKISKTKISEGAEQLILISGEGSGIILQKYSNLNPTKLNEVMLDEMIKESLNYGYELKRADYKRTLASGQTIDVIKAVLKYKDDIGIYEVASIGKKDEGILIVTMLLDDKKTDQGRKIIDLLWNSLLFK